MKNIVPLLALALLCSCGGLRQIQVEEVRNVRLKQFSGNTLAVELEARVNNPSRREVHLNKLELSVTRGTSPFATITTTERLTVPRRSNNFAEVPLEVRLRNMLSVMMAVQLGTFSLDNLVVEGEMTVTAFPVTKKIKIEPINLQAFTEQYGDIVTPLLNLRGR